MHYALLRNLQSKVIIHSTGAGSFLVFMHHTAVQGIGMVKARGQDGASGDSEVS